MVARIRAANARNAGVRLDVKVLSPCSFSMTHGPSSRLPSFASDPTFLIVPAVCARIRVRTSQHPHACSQPCEPAPVCVRACIVRTRCDSTLPRTLSFFSVDDLSFFLLPFLIAHLQYCSPQLLPPTLPACSRHPQQKNHRLRDPALRGFRFERKVRFLPKLPIIWNQTIQKRRLPPRFTSTLHFPLTSRRGKSAPGRHRHHRTRGSTVPATDWLSARKSAESSFI